MRENASLRIVRIYSALIVLCLMAGLLLGVAGCSSGNFVTVGKLSMSHPSDLLIYREDANMSLDLPDGMTGTTGTKLTNSDYSIVIDLVEVDDPSSLGIAALEEYWHSRASNPVDEKAIEELDAKMPGMREVIENAVTDEPALVEINGREALLAITTYKGVRTVFYYIEVDGKIAGAARGIFSQTHYQDNQEYFDTMFSSIRVD